MGEGRGQGHCSPWEESMDVCVKDSTGQLPSISILFAPTHNHALKLAEVSHELYPDNKGQMEQNTSPILYTLREMMNGEWDYVAEGVQEDLDVDLGQIGSKHVKV